MTTYIAYIDDSGNEHRAVYTAVLVPVEHWSATLRSWLTFRQILYENMHIPADTELHSKDIVQPGKGILAPSIRYGVNTERGKRRKLLNLSIAKVGSLKHIRVISNHDSGITPEACYRGLLRKIDRAMAEQDDWAILVVDGEDSDTSHRTAHRALKLDTRRIVEDPWKQDSKKSQWVQMADISAYAVFQGHELHPRRDFMWGWAREYLHSREWPGQCSCP